MTMAERNLELLGNNPYSGRGIVIGRNEDGNPTQVYWIMGRSENSRNRVFCTDVNRVYTEPADLSKVGDPRLIIYNAMRSWQGRHVVTNGSQTDSIHSWMVTGIARDAFTNVLSISSYEPDEPNFTPRINGICEETLGKWRFCLALLRKSDFNACCDRFFFEYGDLAAGLGRCITTYSGNGNPLPSFTGEPYIVPLDGSPQRILDTYWDRLNEANRVSLVVKSINKNEPCLSNVLIRNKYNKVQA